MAFSPCPQSRLKLPRAGSSCLGESKKARVSPAARRPRAPGCVAGRSSGAAIPGCGGAVLAAVVGRAPAVPVWAPHCQTSCSAWWPGVHPARPGSLGKWRPVRSLLAGRGPRQGSAEGTCQLHKRPGARGSRRYAAPGPDRRRSYRRHSRGPDPAFGAEIQGTREQ